jgi:hypothetical protein
MLMGEVLKLGNIIFQIPILFVGSLFFKTEWWLPNVALDEGGGFGIINGDETNEIIIQVGNSSCHDWHCYPFLCGVMGADWKFFQITKAKEEVGGLVVYGNIHFYDATSILVSKDHSREIDLILYKFS